MDGPVDPRKGNGMKEQRRGKRIAMSPEERDAFLTDERTCRAATVSADGSPHSSPLWFVWDGKSLWLNSVVNSQRWTNLRRDPRISVIVDAGRDFSELRGVEILGKVEVVGELPRRGESNPDLEEPERLFGSKYAGGPFSYDGRHGWLRLVPEKIVSWDFRKMPGA
jgi:PPOX class probable F420-dependent enzyme